MQRKRRWNARRKLSEMPSLTKSEEHLTNYTDDCEKKQNTPLIHVCNFCENLLNDDSLSKP